LCPIEAASPDVPVIVHGCSGREIDVPAAHLSTHEVHDRCKDPHGVEGNFCRIKTAR